TYVGNPVACAAANAVLQVISDESLIERATVIGDLLRSRWEEIAVDVPEIGDVRGLGAMVGVEFVKDRETREPNEEFLGAVVGGAMKRGLITVSCGIYHNVLRHLMPLVITDAELNEALDILADVATVASRA
ncbi:MAG TPA: 4-aminobutyrate--2-oxoglutarate transaminase, partial [Actinobacteria bacterium]|nr:4-aminobutyrate--2-oxoglutarate transaminase [Actinomycetota bacterium]